MSTANKKANWRQRIKGVAMVEFVFVLPLFMILIMATAEFGRAFQQYNTLTKSLRDGARYVAGKANIGSTQVVNITGATRTEAQNLVVYGNTQGTGAPILPGLTTGSVTVQDAGGGNVRISVTYPYGSIFAFVPGFFYGGNTTTNSYDFQAAITMRAL
ncbi:MAG TPA: TadE/TadG family type IV pilus assembly protein [Gammaproteobacteria bacterium]